MAILSAQVRARFREHNQARSNMARQTVVATPKRNALTNAEAGIMKCRTASGCFHLSQRLKHNEQSPFSYEMDLDPADSFPSPTSDTDMGQSPYEWSNAYSIIMASSPSSPSPHWTYTTVLPPGQFVYSDEMELVPADSLPSPVSDKGQSSYEWSNPHGVTSNPSSPSPNCTEVTVLPPGQSILSDEMKLDESPSSPRLNDTDAEIWNSLYADSWDCLDESPSSPSLSDTDAPFLDSMDEPSFLFSSFRASPDQKIDDLSLSFSCLDISRVAPIDSIQATREYRALRDRPTPVISPSVVRAGSKRKSIDEQMPFDKKVKTCSRQMITPSAIALARALSVQAALDAVAQIAKAHGGEPASRQTDDGADACVGKSTTVDDENSNEIEMSSEETSHTEETTDQHQQTDDTAMNDITEASDEQTPGAERQRVTDVVDASRDGEPSAVDESSRGRSLQRRSPESHHSGTYSPRQSDSVVGPGDQEHDHDERDGNGRTWRSRGKQAVSNDAVDHGVEGTGDGLRLSETPEPIERGTSRLEEPAGEIAATSVEDDEGEAGELDEEKLAEELHRTTLGETQTGAHDGRAFRSPAPSPRKSNESHGENGEDDDMDDDEESEEESEDEDEDEDDGREKKDDSSDDDEDDDNNNDQGASTTSSTSTNAPTGNAEMRDRREPQDRSTHTSTSVTPAGSATPSRLAVAAPTNAPSTLSAATTPRVAASSGRILVPGEYGMRLETEFEAKARRYRLRKRNEQMSLEDQFREIDVDDEYPYVIDLVYSSHSEDDEPSGSSSRAAVPPRRALGLDAADIIGALKAAKTSKDAQTKRIGGTHAGSKLGQATSSRQLSSGRISKTHKPITNGKVPLSGASKYDKHRAKPHESDDENEGDDEDDGDDDEESEEERDDEAEAHSLQG